jgi:hypothetical protein
MRLSIGLGKQTRPNNSPSRIVLLMRDSGFGPRVARCARDRFICATKPSNVAATRALSDASTQIELRKLAAAYDAQAAVLEAKDLRPPQWASSLMR